MTSLKSVFGIYSKDEEQPTPQSASVSQKQSATASGEGSPVEPKTQVTEGAASAAATETTEAKSVTATEASSGTSVTTLSDHEQACAVLKKTPEYNAYKVKLGDNPAKDVGVLGFARRPANFLFETLLKGTGFSAREPSGGAWVLFGFMKQKILGKPTPLTYEGYKALGAALRKKAAKDPTGTVAITAKEKGIIEACAKKERKAQTYDATAIYGDKTYELSFKEIGDILDSQKIHLSAGLPKRFYMALKTALTEDEVVTVPVNTPIRTCRGKKTSELCSKVLDKPEDYGFQSKEEAGAILNLRFEQLAPLVVKTEEFHIFSDENGKIVDRKPDDKTSVRLVNMSGIRGCTTTGSQEKEIMTRSYTEVLTMNPKGFSIIPAVGMGVWGGSAELYWGSFFEALLAADATTLPETIFASPGKPKIKDEFDRMLAAYKEKYKDNPEMLAKLDKVVSTGEKDIVQLARGLRAKFPDKHIDLVNASDPDVVLGNHVGEYVNKLEEVLTTEENFTAIGSNGLCFEGMTGVREGETEKRILMKEGGVSLHQALQTRKQQAETSAASPVPPPTSPQTAQSTVTTTQ